MAGSDDLEAPTRPRVAADLRRARPLLKVICDGTVSEHEIPERGSLIVGRSPDADIRVAHASVSRRHACFTIDNGIRVEDLGSQNGTRVRGEVLAAGVATELFNNDVVDVGDALIIVEGVQDRSSAPKASTPKASTPKASAPRDSTPKAAAPPTSVVDGVVIAAESMQRIHALLERVAPSMLNVLLLGETGVGKEILAEALHRSSLRSDAPFIAINCAALSETLLESELFGHVAGAFTGAERDKRGLLASANGGTVFLDEVGEMSLATQAKALRVIDQRSVRPVGGNQNHDIDVRFVAATNRDLRAEVAMGSFRQDLFFRLNGLSVTIPPLRERRAEIRPLALEFLHRLSLAQGREPPKIDPDAMGLLEGHTWPGNIRELRNVVERAVILADDIITTAHLAPQTEGTTGDDRPTDLQRELDALERQRIIDALEACAGNQTQAAARLAISRSTLVRRIRAYGIPRPRKKPPT